MQKLTRQDFFNMADDRAYQLFQSGNDMDAREYDKMASYLYALNKTNKPDVEIDNRISELNDTLSRTDEHNMFAAMNAEGQIEDAFNGIKNTISQRLEKADISNSKTAKNYTDAIHDGWKVIMPLNYFKPTYCVFTSRKEDLKRALDSEVQPLKLKDGIFTYQIKAPLSLSTEVGEARKLIMHESLKDNQDLNELTKQKEGFLQYAAEYEAFENSPATDLSNIIQGESIPSIMPDCPVHSREEQAKDRETEHERRLFERPARMR